MGQYSFWPSVCWVLEVWPTLSALTEYFQSDNLEFCAQPILKTQMDRVLPSWWIWSWFLWPTSCIGFLNDLLSFRKLDLQNWAWSEKHVECRLRLCPTTISMMYCRPALWKGCNIHRYDLKRGFAYFPAVSNGKWMSCGTDVRHNMQIL